MKHPTNFICQTHIINIIDHIKNLSITFIIFFVFNFIIDHLSFWFVYYFRKRKDDFLVRLVPQLIS